MIKRKVDKASFESLSDPIKALYSEKNGMFVLNLEHDDDTGELKRAKDREVEARRAAEARVLELETRVQTLGGDTSRRSQDIEALTRSWEDKLKQRETELTEQLSKKDNYIKRTYVDTVAKQMATELSTVPLAMVELVRKRITADFEGDALTTRVLDNQGNLSSLTVDDLKKEFLENKDLSGILIGSKASGSSTSSSVGSHKAGGAHGASGQVVDFTKLSPADRVAYLKAKSGETN